MPLRSNCASMSVILILSALALNSGLPAPGTTRQRRRRYSSIRHLSVSVEQGSALPKMGRYLPPCSPRFATSSAALPFTNLVPLHSAWAGVREDTSLGTLSTKPTIWSVSDGENAAVP